MSHNKTEWTFIYGTPNEEANEMYYQVRLVPDFMDMEAAGLPHGFGIHSMLFSTEEAANEGAKLIDGFMDAMTKDMQCLQGVQKHSAARKLCANLGRRYRTARRTYKRTVASADNLDERIKFALEAQKNEALNAFQSSKALLNELD